MVFLAMMMNNIIGFSMKYELKLCIKIKKLVCVYFAYITLHVAVLEYNRHVQARLQRFFVFILNDLLCFP